MSSLTPSSDRVLREAEEQGADLAALRENLRLTPAERFAELVAMNVFHASVQARTLPAGLPARPPPVAPAREREQAELGLDA